jgi:hypothetical protein
LSGVRAAVLAAVVLAVAAGAAAVEVVPTEITSFGASAEGQAVPTGWRSTTVPGVSRTTTYRVVTVEGRKVVHGEARAAMSGLDHRVSADPERTPWLHWRWKVSRSVRGGEAGSRAGDDYSARVYVFFDYDLARLGFAARMKVKAARLLHGDAVPAAALCYVWDAARPAGTVVPSAYTDRVRMIVVDSGDAQAGRWIAHARNVAEDFTRAFGESAPRVSGVAIATDTDNTGDAVEAWYGELRFDADGVAGR